jgi:hypothetical protein
MTSPRRKQQRRKRPARQLLVVDQVYSFEDETGTQWHWSIAVARHLAEADGILEMISLRDLGITLEFVRDQYPGMDEEYALTTDLDKPLLFVPFRDKVRLVDGWNRLFHAVVLGRDLLPAYFLTQEQADAALICRLPPGQGADWGQHANR